MAKRELDITKLLVPTDSADAKTIDSIIAQLPAAPAPTTPAKPTVEELSGVKPTTPQEPLVDPATRRPDNLSPKVIPE